MSTTEDSPKPTAHEVVPGCSLDRRTFLQGTAMAAAIAGGGVGATGTTSASTASGIVDGLKEAVTGAATAGAIGGPQSLAVWVGALALSELTGGVDRDPTVNRIYLHEMVVNEIHWMDSHFVNFGNHMQDSKPVASLEARHGIASSWEDGESAPDALDRSHARIEQYYALPEFNHLHAGFKALLQLSFIAGSGFETDPQYKLLGSGEDDTGEFVQFWLTDRREEVEPELLDGTVVDENAFDNIDHIEGAEGKPTSPIIEVHYPPNDGDDDYGDGEKVYESPLTNDVLESWDTETEELTFVADDGTEFYWPEFQINSSNLPEADDDDDLPEESLRAFDGKEWLNQRQEVRDLADDVIGTYEQAFVEDIHYELEQGNITPEQVRSPEGMARFLSGTDDPESERFQLAWMQQFGFESPDLRLVSGMQIEWSGATDTNLEPSADAERYIYPDEFVENEVYNGILFARDTTAQIQTGNRYAIGVPVVATDDDHFVTLDPNDGSEQARYSPEAGTVRNLELSPDGKTVYVALDGEVREIDLTDGTEGWSYTEFSDSAYGLHLSTDGTLYAALGDNEVHAIDANDGSQKWTADGYASNVRGVSTSPDGETVFVGSADVYALNADDGTEQWSYTGLTDAVGALTASTDGVVFVGDYGGALTALNANDGTEEWVHNPDGSAARDISLSPTEDTVYRIGSDYYALDPDNGTERWSYDGPGGYIEQMVPSPCGNVVYAIGSDELHALDPEDGSLMWDTQSPNGVRDATIWQPEGQIDGVAARSVMYDESTDDSEGQGQIDIWHGVAKITDMWDANGATVEHVDDQTIEDIEEVTGENIDTIIDEMDQFDDRSDIRFTRHVIDIMDEYNIDDADRDTVHTNEPDYSSPDYDSFDSSEFAEEMATLEEMIAQLEEEEDDEDEDDTIGFGLPGFDLDGAGGQLAGLAIIAVVILAVVGVVTDLIPGLGN